MREVEQPTQHIKKNAVVAGKSGTSIQFVVALENKKSLRHQGKHR